MKQLLIVLVLFVLSFQVTVFAENTVHSSQCIKHQKGSTCKVSGGEIKEDIYIEQDAQKVYFCCQLCVKQYTNNPDKYINKLRKTEEKPSFFNEDDDDFDDLG